MSDEATSEPKAKRVTAPRGTRTVAITRLWLEQQRKNPPPKLTAYWDAEDRALGVRVLPSGSISFVCRYWTGERERWETIGRHPADKVAEMRSKAKTMDAEAYSGGKYHDLKGDREAAERERERQAVEQRLNAARLAGETVAHYSALWLAQLPTAVSRTGRMLSAPALRQYRDVLSRIVLPSLGELPVHEVTKRDVKAMYGAARARSPFQANRALAVVALLFSWLAEEEIIPDSQRPATDIRRAKEPARGKNAAVRLSDEQEGALVWAITEEINRGFEELEKSRKAKVAGKDRAPITDPYGAVALLVLLDSGRRKSDVLGLEWANINFSTGIATIPKSKAKRDGDCFYISERALAAIRRLPRIVGNPFVFVGRGDGQRRADLASVWRRCKRAAGIVNLAGGLKGFRIHDLRHNRITKMIEGEMTDTHVIQQVGLLNYQMLTRYSHARAKSSADTQRGLPVIGPAAPSAAPVASIAEARKTRISAG